MTENGDPSLGKREERPEETPGSGPPPLEAPTAGRSPVAPPEEIRFRVSILSLVYRYLFLGLLTLLGVFFLYLVVPMSLASSDFLVLGILLVWVLALLRYWVYLLDMPYRIGLKPGEPLEFRSILRKRMVAMEEIRAFKVSPVYPSFLRILTTRKKTIPVINHVSGLHDLIGRVKQANPALETKGC